MTNENLNQSEYDVQTTTDGTTGTETPNTEQSKNWDYVELNLSGLKNGYYDYHYGTFLTSENAIY